VSHIRKSKAFTLIELIVVVIIIGVLAAIASVAYTQFVVKARTAAVLHSATSVAEAVNAAAAQNGTSPNDQLAVATYTDPAFVVGGISVKVVGGTLGATNFSITDGGESACVTGGATTSDSATAAAGAC